MSSSYRPVHATNVRPVDTGLGTERWRHRPANSNWGDFGADDQLGRLNFVTAEKVMQGIAEVREGRTFSLSLPLDYPGGGGINARRHPPRIKPTPRGEGVAINFALSRENPLLTDVICDDYVEMFLQYSTQWDALSHVGGFFDVDGDGVDEMVYYNGFRAGVHILGPEDKPAGEGESRAMALGVERMAEHGIQGRGVLVDLRAHLGGHHQLVTGAQLKDILRKDGIAIEQGDMVCLHTGFAQVLLDRKKNPEPDILSKFGAALDGRDPELHQWVIESGIAALVADNYGVESVPGRPVEGRCAMLPLHELCLFRLGMAIGEVWHLTPLAEALRAQGRSRFLLTAPPLRLPGAVGSPVNPIATL